MSKQDRREPEAAWDSISTRGILDIHVHTAPDTRPRWHTALEFGDRASRAGMAGFVIKHHDRPTVSDAAEVRERYPALRVYGGIALNRSAGGLNPANVAEALAAGARIVWLPTHDGTGERSFRGMGGGLEVLDSGGELLPQLREILKKIAAADAVLATGHIAAAEVTAVVVAARQHGVRRVLVNHVEIPFLHFGADLQKRWRDDGAWIERCYPRPEAQDGFDQIAREIREVGASHSILATDLGRRDLPCPVQGWKRMLYELKARGFPDDELATMTSANPSALFGAAGGRT